MYAESCSAGLRYLSFFVFKQKTAYEIEYGLVGSEMCIRDRLSFEEVLWQSSNIGAAKMGIRLDPAVHYQYLRKLSLIHI